MTDKIKAFAKLLEKEQKTRCKSDYPTFNDSYVNENYSVKIIPGRKYTKVDVGTSGKYMIDQEGNIWGIKAYGKVHHGHNYGTLDTVNNWYWGRYVAVKKELKINEM